MENIIKEPYFEKAVVGCYVRVLIGEIPSDEPNGKCEAIYRMGLINGIERGQRPYKLLDTDATTSIRLKVIIGKQIKHNVKITLTSNSRITENEFSIYKKDMDNTRGCKMLTKREASSKRTEMLATLKHKYTSTEIGNPTPSPSANPTPTPISNPNTNPTPNPTPKII
jgi:hypothetical protein